jgi:hypothetical protein
MESEGGIVGPRDDGVHELGENLSSRDVDTGIMGPLDDGDDQVKPPPDMFQVFVKGLDGMTMTFDVYDNFYAQSLKVLVWQQTGLPPHMQRLFYNSKQLADGELLTNEATMHLVLSLSGGMPGGRKRTMGGDNDVKMEMLADLKREIQSKQSTVGNVDITFLRKISDQLVFLLKQVDEAMKDKGDDDDEDEADENTGKIDVFVTGTGLQDMGTSVVDKLDSALNPGHNNPSRKFAAATKVVYADFFKQTKDVRDKLTMVDDMMIECIQYAMVWQYADGRGAIDWSIVNQMVKDVRNKKFKTIKRRLRQKAGQDAYQQGYSAGTASAINSARGGAHGAPSAGVDIMDVMMHGDAGPR